MNELNTTRPDSADFPDLIRGLQHTDAYPHPADEIKVLETHISWIVLAGSFAYKIKKPVKLAFLDFSTLTLREYFCRQELALNRRFAPELYIDVVPIGGSPAAPRIGAEPALEWAVQMHRFAADAGLDRQLAERRVSADDMRQLAELVARVHEGGAIASAPEFGSFNSIRGPALANFTTLAETFNGTTLQPIVESLQHRTEQSADALRAQFEQRRAAHRVRECHGDLHLGNIVRLESGCVPFDCLEFDPMLGQIDVISDIAFLFMDLLHHDRDDLAYIFLNRYFELTGDYAGLSVLRFYTVYRALVRAKTAAIRAAQSGKSGDDTEARGYLKLAGHLADERHRPLLVVCHGLSGSGKTWLSERLIPALPALRLRSDVIRKQLHGLSELADSHSELHTGLYSEAAGQLTYTQLAEFAADGLAAGLNIIVDATCLRRADRDALAEVAAAGGAAFVLLRCDAQRSVLEARICARRGHDASEADLAVLADQLMNVEPLSDTEREHALSINTADVADIRRIAAALRARARPGGQKN